MSSVLAVDGGQSGIRATHSSGGTIVEVDGVSRLEGDVVLAVAKRAVEAWRRLGSPATSTVVLGLTTAPTDARGCDRLATLIAEQTDAREVWLCDDTVTAHAGALGGQWGVVLRVGTGVACLAVANDERAPAVIDGHGYLLGDDGAGYWIGREGLRAVLRARDGRGASTALSEAAAQRFGAGADLHVRIHSLPRAVNEIGQFAQDVLTAASAGDQLASAIVTGAADALTQTVEAAIRATGETGSVPVAIGGRLLESPSILRERTTSAIDHACPTAVVSDAIGSPLDGALGMGLGASTRRYASLIHVWKGLQ